MEPDDDFALQPREWTEPQWRDIQEHAILHIQFADGTTLDLDAEQRDAHFWEGGDEDIVSETRFTQVRYQLVAEGDEDRLEFTEVNADGQRQVIGGPEDGRVIEAPRALTERVQTVMQQLAEFVHGRDEAEHGQDRGR
jgi:hypothetical protein